ncbi:hypothetical protein A8709_22110 [Paenibacillus pectinilyticus]|uniref:Uncharacterized protein n=1 Tax=Paenibacillus pectinilyticus TaxID=512399 RepID=A0A1C0ZY09_9BACL|nr:hypothetical protein [Paenibacillus pectinilyticus]OCT13016.1 hypothetical protein A8709_22110 [Paenibacillus pectinilyticus]
MSQRSSEMTFLTVLMLIIVICSGCAARQNHSLASPAYETVAYINDSPIDERELQLFMNGVKAQVAAYFKQTYNSDDSPSFWTTSFHGEVPIEKVKQSALEQLKEVKVQQLLAQQYSLVDDLSYSAFLGNWTKENQRRKEALKNNQVIYGPKQYDERGYYNYVFSNLVLKVKASFQEKTAPKGGEDNASGMLTDDQKQRALDAKYAEKVKQMMEAAQVRIVDAVFQKMKLQ